MHLNLQLAWLTSRGLVCRLSNVDVQFHSILPKFVQRLDDAFFSCCVEKDHLCVKRKITLEDETPRKKNKFNQDKSSFIRGREGDLDDIDSLCIKRKLKLEDDCSSKKNQKIVDCSSGMHLSLTVLYRIEIHPSVILQKLHPWNLIAQAQSMNSSSPLQSYLLGASMDTESVRGKTIWYLNFHAKESDNIAHPLVLS